MAMREWGRKSPTWLNVTRIKALSHISAWVTFSTAVAVVWQWRPQLPWSHVSSQCLQCLPFVAVLFKRPLEAEATYCAFKAPSSATPPPTHMHPVLLRRRRTERSHRFWCKADTTDQEPRAAVLILKHFVLGTKGAGGITVHGEKLWHRQVRCSHVKQSRQHTGQSKHSLNVGLTLQVDGQARSPSLAALSL